MPSSLEVVANMPRGPKGEKRPADVIGAAVMIGKIATGEIEDMTRGRQERCCRGAGAHGRQPRPQDAWRYPGNGRWRCGNGHEGDGCGRLNRCEGG